ncbi:MAG: Imidazolonepropionase [Bacteroidetes bacterium]|jgi:imidazolonepropionase|nr:Imidazolonepropionase [Bacteroidota bacterium]MDF2453249.1 Imidazolonepropionase [Bacteroidota bacterium]
MSRLLIKNIKTLVQVREASVLKVSGSQMKELPSIDNAWMAVDNGLIADFGPMEDFPGIEDWKGLEVIDCEGKLILPSYADSHTHIVYAGNREVEFIDRINGLSYEEIFARGGGILNSAKKLADATEDELFEQTMVRLKEVIGQGTGSIEIKSGYGLSVESELKMLRVIKRIKDLNLVPVKATFLGAHALPVEYKNNKQGYIDLIINDMLPKIAAEKLADYIDVFCEQNYFTYEETKQILEAGKKHGLVPKVHAEQLSHFGGIQAGVECGAISVDHLEFCDDADIELLKKSDTMATVLPGAAFFLGLPLPPARKMIDAGLPIAFASDFNPGSSPSGNMNFMMSLGCVQYKLTPEEVINACTINSAYAMQLSHEVGSITIGKKANFFITKPISSYGFIPYSFGSNLIEVVYLNGVKQ